VPTADSESWTTIGRAGLLGRARDRRLRELDARFGHGNWRLRHALGDRVLGLSDAALEVERSYLLHFGSNPKCLRSLCAIAADVFESARSNVRSGLDYGIQERKHEHVFDIAIRRVVRQLGLEFAGKEWIRIGGSCRQQAELSPGHVPFHDPARIVQPAFPGWWQADSVMSFWLSNRIIQAKTNQT
jgi:hypothetical protein